MAARDPPVPPPPCPTARDPPTAVQRFRYAHGDECVGPHADHISMLGPRPIIVGLSLGASVPPSAAHPPIEPSHSTHTLRR
jgi:hypothetical protein